MIDPQYPYYRKLQKFLDKKQVAIYKNLTNKLSLIDSIDFNEVYVLKSSKTVSYTHLTLPTNREV